MNTLSHVLRRLAEGAQKPTVFAGFDGCIDSIVKPVRRFDSVEREYFKSIDAFGRYLCEKAGKSCAFPLDTLQRRMGGNAPLFSLAAALLGAHVVCAVCAGEQHETFAPLYAACETHSVGEPCACTAFEFADGKVLMADNGAADTLDYAQICRRFGADALEKTLQRADVIALLNWSELKNATDIWENSLRVLVESTRPQAEKRVLVDLCDFSGHGDAAVLEMLAVLCAGAQHATVMLSLNGNEAEELARRLHVEASTSQALAQRLREKTGVSIVTIHTRQEACAAYAGGVVYVPTVTVATPVTSTGAGDNFNAALAVGWGGGLSPEEYLLLANTVSSAYVRHGHSNTLAQLLREESPALPFGAT